MALLYPVHRQTAILDAVRARCVAPTQQHVVVARHGALDVLLVAGGAFYKAYSVPVAGVVVGVGVLRSPRSNLDWIVFTLVGGSVHVVSFDAATATFVRRAHFREAGGGDASFSQAPHERPVVATSPDGAAVLVQTSFTTFVLVRAPPAGAVTATVLGGSFGAIRAAAWLSRTHVALVSEMPAYQPHVAVYTVVGTRLVEHTPPMTPAAEATALVRLAGADAALVLHGSEASVITAARGLVPAAGAIPFEPLAGLALALGPADAGAGAGTAPEKFLLAGGEGGLALVELSDALSAAPRLRVGHADVLPPGERVDLVALDTGEFVAYGRYRPCQLVSYTPDLDAPAFAVSATIPSLGPVIALEQSPAGEIVACGGGFGSATLSRLSARIPVSLQPAAPQKAALLDVWRVDEDHVVVTSLLRTRVLATASARLFEVPAYKTLDPAQRTLAASAAVQVTPTQVRIFEPPRTVELESVLAAASDTLAVAAFAAIVTVVPVAAGAPPRTHTLPASATVVAAAGHRWCAAAGASLWLDGDREVPLGKAVRALQYLGRHILAGAEDGTLQVLAPDSAEPVFARKLGETIEMIAVVSSTQALVATAAATFLLTAETDHRFPVVELSKHLGALGAVGLQGRYVLTVADAVQIVELGPATAAMNRSVTVRGQVHKLVASDRDLYVTTLHPPSEGRGGRFTVDRLDPTTLEVAATWEAGPGTTVMGTTAFALDDPRGTVAGLVVNVHHNKDDARMLLLHAAALAPIASIAAMPTRGLKIVPSGGGGRRGVTLVSGVRSGLEFWTISSGTDSLHFALQKTVRTRFASVVEWDYAGGFAALGSELRGFFAAHVEPDAEDAKLLWRDSMTPQITAALVLGTPATPADLSCLIADGEGRLLELQAPRPSGTLPAAEERVRRARRAHALDMYDQVNVLRTYAGRVGWAARLQERGLTAAAASLEPLALVGTTSGGVYAYCSLGDAALSRGLLALQALLAARTTLLTGRVYRAYRAFVPEPAQASAPPAEDAPDAIIDWEHLQQYFALPVATQTEMARETGLSHARLVELGAALDLLL